LADCKRFPIHYVNFFTTHVRIVPSGQLVDGRAVWLGKSFGGYTLDQYSLAFCW